MNTFLLTLLVATTVNATTYNFKYKEYTSIRVEAKSMDTAFRKAAKLCYRTLTNDRYPGEERGLQIIDICSNPVSIK